MIFKDSLQMIPFSDTIEKNKRGVFMKNIIGIVISFAYILVLMIAAKYFEKFNKEASRKFIHILLSNWWLIAMAFFDNVIFAIIPPIAFVVINWISYHSNLIKVMERDEAEQDGLGTVYFAFSLIPLVFLSFGLTQNPLIGLTGFFIMTYGDGFASLVGKAIPSKEYKVFGSKKTMAGSITMFFISLFVTIAVFIYMNTSMWFVKAIGISLLATILEAISGKGLDNLTVPIVTAILTYFVI